ncbi:hypothetical protein TrVFT333_002002 [Trichoderma virens FT-333]|nr:hypothetical protein TrVFT333_002002 [Trichoderma virens FT-333]
MAQNEKPKPHDGLTHKSYALSERCLRKLPARERQAHRRQHQQQLQAMANSDQRAPIFHNGHWRNMGNSLQGDPSIGRNLFEGLRGIDKGVRRSGKHSCELPQSFGAKPDGIVSRPNAAALPTSCELNLFTCCVLFPFEASFCRSHTPGESVGAPPPSIGSKTLPILFDPPGPIPGSAWESERRQAGSRARFGRGHWLLRVIGLCHRVSYHRSHSMGERNRVKASS